MNEVQILTFLLSFFLSFLLGLSLVKYLTVHPLKMNFYTFLSTILGVFVVFLLVLGAESNLFFLLFASLGAFLAFIIGYIIMASKVLLMKDPRNIPELTRMKGDMGKGHTAVIYFTHGEPETYNPIGWINQFKEFDEQNVPFIPFPIRPLFLYQLRKKYLQVGKSDHRKMHNSMIKSLEEEFRKQGDYETRFYLSFLDDEPRPDAAILQALNEGASKLIVSTVFVSVSNHTLEGEELIKKINFEDYGIKLKITQPLWDSVTLHRMFLERANQSLGDADKSKVGILLVGHGQPDEWDEFFPTEIEHEVVFRERILELFKRDGYKEENLGLAWMEFKEPKPAEKIEHFIRNGVDYIVFFSASISADSIHSQYDIPSLVYQAKVPEYVNILDMGAWNNDPWVIKAIKERIDALME